MHKFRVGIDNYGLFPLRLDPLQTLQWAKDHGAEGVHFSGLDPAVQARIDKSYLRDLAAVAKQHDMYLEWGGAQHIPRDTTNWKPKDLLESNRIVAEQAAAIGTRVVRSCSGGLIRWQPDSPMTETLLQEMAGALMAQRQMLIDHDVVLAIETHFEFTSFELLRLFDRCQAYPGEWLGICLDTMNCLIMLEDPVCAARRLLPWIVCTHIKDGGIMLTSQGLQSFPVRLGAGVVNLPEIVRLLKSLSADVPLSVEGHGGSFVLPIFDASFMSKFPDLTAEELSRLIQLSQWSDARQASGCCVTERVQWPEVCEERLASDVNALRAIVASPA
jgi:sugar phosphate isomerase/epimerase